MNVYDFDGTIYNGDSTIDFYLYLLKKNPLLVRYAPKQIFGFVLYFCKRITKTKLKEMFFSFLNGTDAVKLVDSFWDTRQEHIFQWYLEQHREDDIIISASPEFLLKPICKRLGIKGLIASEVDPKTGAFLGNNCYGSEKVSRLAAQYSFSHIDRFYSDSLSDLPLAKIADRAFLIKKGVITAWKVTK